MVYRISPATTSQPYQKIMRTLVGRKRQGRGWREVGVVVAVVVAVVVVVVEVEGFIGQEWFLATGWYIATLSSKHITALPEDHENIGGKETNMGEAGVECGWGWGWWWL